jgi:hypothetical protein
MPNFKSFQYQVIYVDLPNEMIVANRALSEIASMECSERHNWQQNTLQRH